jgi:hypothetical protein
MPKETNEMNNEQKAALRDAANKAILLSDGKWRTDSTMDPIEIVGPRQKAIRHGKRGEWTICSLEDWDGKERELARFIAKANPVAVLSLLNEIDRLRARETFYLGEYARGVRDAATWHLDRALEYDRESEFGILPCGNPAYRKAIYARFDAQSHRDHAAAILAILPENKKEIPNG